MRYYGYNLEFYKSVIYCLTNKDFDEFIDNPEDYYDNDLVDKIYYYHCKQNLINAFRANNNRIRRIENINSALTKNSSNDMITIDATFYKNHIVKYKVLGQFPMTIIINALTYKSYTGKKGEPLGGIHWHIYCNEILD